MNIYNSGIRLFFLNIKKRVFTGSARTKTYKKNIALLMICQILTVAVSLLLVPLTLNYLGVEEFGIWITLTTIVAWFSFFDIGLSHGLRNKYAEAKATNNIVDMRKYISTAVFTMLGISIVVFLAFAIVSRYIDWSTVLNAPPRLRHTLHLLSLAVGGMVCIRLIVSITNSLLTADQEPFIPAMLVFFGQLASLLVVYLITIYTAPSILYIGIALSACQIFPLLIATFYFFTKRYREVRPSIHYFSRTHIRLIFSLGLRFFFIQITALVLFQSNNLIIAHACGLNDVAEFNIAYKYLNVLFILFAAFLTPLWSATTEAYVKGDTKWISQSLKTLNKVWLGLILIGCVMISLSPFVYKIWLSNRLAPNSTLLIITFVYFLFLSRSTMYRSFMNGVGKISLQLFVTGIQAVIHIPIALLLGKQFGITGVVTLMALWQVINSVWEQVQFKRILEKSARGIWNR